MIPVQQLRQCPARRQVYFGLPKQGPHAGLDGWVSYCNNLRKKPNNQHQNILYRIEKIRYNIEMRQKMRDWYLVTVIRRRERLHETRRRFAAWRKLFLLSRYKILTALSSNMRPLMRNRFLIWRENTNWLRAVTYYDIAWQRQVFYALTENARNSRRKRMQLRLATWKRMILFVRKLKRIAIFDKLYLKMTWYKWKWFASQPLPTIPASPRVWTALIEVVRRWMLNQVQPYFEKWKLKPPPDEDYNCVCIAKICRGQHCDCRRDVHFRRRLQYCFQEVEAARDDKIRIKADLKIAKQVLRASSSEDKRLKLKRDRFAKRVSSTSDTAAAALSSSLLKRVPTSRSAPDKKRGPAPYEGVGEVARRDAAVAKSGSPHRLNTSLSSLGRSRRSPERVLRPDSPLRGSVRKGVLHSMDGAVLSSHNRLRYSHHISGDEDISHWDLKHLQAQAPDLSQYDSLEF